MMCVWAVWYNREREGGGREGERGGGGREGGREGERERETEERDRDVTSACTASLVPRHSCRMLKINFRITSIVGPIPQTVLIHWRWRIYIFDLEKEAEFSSR